MPSTRRRVVALAALVAAAFATAAADALPASRAVDAAAPAPRAGDAARPVQPPVRGLPGPQDMVSVSQAATLSSSVRERAESAAAEAGARSSVGRAGSIQMTRLRRGAQSVQEPPAGWRIPFGATVLPLRAVRTVMGDVVADALGRPGNVVMAATTAALRGARIGDVMEIRTARGAILPLAISQIVPDAMVGGTELVLNPDDARTIGLTQPARVLIWDIPSRSDLDAALDRHGVIDSSRHGTLGSSDSRMRVRRSWDPRDPDGSLGIMQTKALLGEFAFVIHSDGSMSISSSWIDAHLACGPINYCRTELNPTIRIRARCHDDVRPALEGALADLVDAGLAWTIDVGNANTYGGCWYPRFNRLATTTYVGHLSRHSWAMALDTNTTQNPQGGTPHMDCRTVRIFRRWGFAWGGNFLTPDGMHFEYVGERRDRFPYPSKYCPNDVSPGDAQGTHRTEAAVIFSHDGVLP